MEKERNFGPSTPHPSGPTKFLLEERELIVTMLEWSDVRKHAGRNKCPHMQSRSSQITSRVPSTAQSAPQTPSAFQEGQREGLCATGHRCAPPPGPSTSCNRTDLRWFRKGPRQRQMLSPSSLTRQDATTLATQLRVPELFPPTCLGHTVCCGALEPGAPSAPDCAEEGRVLGKLGSVEERQTIRDDLHEASITRTTVRRSRSGTRMLVDTLAPTSPQTRAAQLSGGKPRRPSTPHVAQAAPWWPRESGGLATPAESGRERKRAPEAAQEEDPETLRIKIATGAVEWDSSHRPHFDRMGSKRGHTVLWKNISSICADVNYCLNVRETVGNSLSGWKAGPLAQVNFAQTLGHRSQLRPDGL